MQSNIAKQYQSEGSDIAAESLSAYNDALKTMPPEQAIKVGQQTYDSLVTPWKQNLPPNIAQSVSPTFDPIRARATLSNAKTAEDIDKAWEVREDYGHLTANGKPTEYAYNKTTGQAMDVTRKYPYQPSGEGEPKTAGAKPERYTGKTTDGKTVNLIDDPNGAGFLDADTRQPVKGVTDVRKVGTNPQLDMGAGLPAGAPDVHGTDYLKGLPDNIQPQVKALAEGRMSFPSGFALRSPYWQQMLQAVAQYDPSFDAVNYNARAKTRADFTSGTGAKNITSIDTSIGHLGTLLKAADGLDNYRWPAANMLKNLYESATGDPRIVAFNTAKQAVATELTRVFRGTGGSVHDVEEWETNINAANSPAQLHKAIETAVDLLHSRIDAVGEQYKRGMGTSSDVLDLLTPEAKKTLAALPGGDEIAKPGGGTTPETKAAAGDIPTPSDFKPGVNTLTNPSTGETWTLKEGKVVKQ